MIGVVFSGLVALVALVWSADRFVSGAVGAARRFGASPLLVGMVIVGFGTSLPELMVSVFAAVNRSPGVALGNAYGSNIVNIALILGLTALIGPVRIRSGVLRLELPILATAGVLAALQSQDGTVGRADAGVLLVGFAALLAWTVRRGMSDKDDAFGIEMGSASPSSGKTLKEDLIRTVVGLGILVASSRVLVWSAVETATAFGVSDLVIGLTIVALGTSLPELASSIAAARQNEHDVVLGNILGSNLFNTLAVVGIAAAVHPLDVAPEILTRDIPVMLVLTSSLFLTGYGFRGPGRLSRVEGGIMVAAWVGYIVWIAGTIPD